ncbi:MAG: TetR/AcrR family transcriptional regulator [Amylibacter sp.]|jgi:AcrR family transcriptional regulator|nr:TetR/AcrR family transcriptional regulator [Amylibacter sp.]
MNKRLKKQDWVGAGLQALAKDGPAALKADRLAAKLAVSRGSFYWHFENLASFQTAVLDEWVRFATGDVVARIEQVEPGGARLDRLLEIAHQADPSLERGIRAWAASNKGVAARVEAVDQMRLDYLANTLREAGWPDAQADGRAVLLYLSNLGRVVVSETLARAVPLDELQASARYSKD